MKDSFIFYTKYEEQISLLSDAQAGVLFRALICYQSNKELPEMDGMTNIVFVAMRQQIDEEKQKNQMLSLVRKQAGSKGGRPAKSIENKGNKPKKPNAFFGFEEENLSLLENKEKRTKKENKVNTLVKEELERKKETCINNNLTPSACVRGDCYENIISHYAGDIDGETRSAIWKYIQYFQAKTGCFILNDQLKQFLQNVKRNGLLFASAIMGCLNDEGIDMAMVEIGYWCG